jgi:hypothetical protein
MRTLFKSLFLTLLASGTGCGFYATRSIHTAGLYRERLTSIRSIRKGSDGALALVVTAEQTRIDVSDFVWFSHETTVATKLRYVVAIPESLMPWLDGLKSSNQVTPDGHVTVKYLSRPFRRYYRWSVVPPRIFAQDATEDGLPISLQGNAQIYPPERDVPLEVGNHKYIVNFSHCAMDGLDDGQLQRKWWGYPLQIFIIPAIAIDIATIPFQLPIGMNQFHEMVR